MLERRMSIERIRQVEEKLMLDLAKMRELVSLLLAKRFDRVPNLPQDHDIQMMLHWFDSGEKPSPTFCDALIKCVLRDV